MADRIGGCVGPIVVVEVRERHVADAEHVVGAQRAERVGDRVAAFDPQERGDPPLSHLAPDIGCATGEGQVLRILGDHPSSDVDLLELIAHHVERAQIAGHVHRPELRPDHAGAEAGDVRIEASPGREIIRLDVTRWGALLPDHPGQIVVCVDQGAGPKDFFRVAEGRVLGLGARALTREHCTEDQARGPANTVCRRLHGGAGPGRGPDSKVRGYNMHVRRGVGAEPAAFPPLDHRPVSAAAFFRAASARASVAPMRDRRVGDQTLRRPAWPASCSPAARS